MVILTTITLTGYRLFNFLSRIGGNRSFPGSVGTFDLRGTKREKITKCRVSKHRWILGVAVGLSFSLTFARHAETQGLSREEIPGRAHDGARREGKVVWYGSMRIEQATPLIKKFQQKYPYIKVEFLRDKGEGSVNRILTEARTRTYNADVILAKLRALVLLKRQGFLTRYSSGEHNFFPEGFRDPEGFWTTFYTSVLVVGYNSQLVKPQDVPKNYDSLLAPRWKGEIGMDFYEYDWFTGLLEVMGRERGIAYMKSLARQRPILRVGHTLLSQLLAGGEFPLAIQYPNEVEWIKRKGAPVGWARMDFPAPTSLTSLSILSKAPHPNAGRLFYDYLLSEESARYLVTVKRIPARTSAKPDWLPKDFKFFLLGEPLLTDVMDRNMKDFDSLFK